MISVIIATVNRPTNIVQCVQSILQSTYRQLEIIVVDQSTNNMTYHALKVIPANKVKYIRHQQQNKSTALNKGIAFARGDILAFTDDDCIVSRRWLSVLYQTTVTHPKQSAFFGRTLPYQPNKHADRICPSTFTKTARKIISVPSAHFISIGFGNNMAIRKSTIETTELFKSWLGPGSIVNSAEDAEMALRLLIQHHTILYEPTMTVFHNRWITASQMRGLARSYTCGEMACYGYFFFQGFTFASPVLVSNIKTALRQLFSGKNILHESLNVLGSMFGLLVGLWYAWRDLVRSAS